MKQFFRSLHLNWTDTLVSIFGSAFLAFGLYNVHALSGVTEGGVLGLTLLLDHWFSISPAVSGAILNVLCYAMGWKLLGAVLVGTGAGVCVRAGGAPGGDDALAMSVSHVTGWGVERVYLLSDLLVLLLSLTYIPARRIGFSLLTVILSGQIIGLIQKIPRKKEADKPAQTA